MSQHQQGMPNQAILPPTYSSAPQMNHQQGGVITSGVSLTDRQVSHLSPQMRHPYIPQQQQGMGIGHPGGVSIPQSQSQQAISMNISPSPRHPLSSVVPIHPQSSHYPPPRMMIPAQAQGMHVSGTHTQQPMITSVHQPPSNLMGQRMPNSTSIGQSLFTSSPSSMGGPSPSNSSGMNAQQMHHAFQARQQQHVNIGMMRNQLSTQGLPCQPMIVGQPQRIGGTPPSYNNQQGIAGSVQGMRQHGHPSTNPNSHIPPIHHQQSQHMVTVSSGGGGAPFTQQMIRPQINIPIQQHSVAMQSPASSNHSQQSNIKRKQGQGQQQPSHQNVTNSGQPQPRLLAQKILPERVRELVPESQAYMDLLAFERKLDATIMRKRLDIQEALKRPIKQKRKLRIFISNTAFPGKCVPPPPTDGVAMNDASSTASEMTTPASWELRVEGRLVDAPPNSASSKRKFSSFFKSLVIELDKELYGPDNHLVEWHRSPVTQETDGFQVKRPGNRDVRCTILLLLDHQPLQFKLDGRLARLLGVHTQTRPVIISALWQYIKTNGLQDADEKEFIRCDPYLRQIFQVEKMKFAEIPQRINPLLHPPDPIVINHVISVSQQLPSTDPPPSSAINCQSDQPMISSSSTSETTNGSGTANSNDCSDVSMRGSGGTTTTKKTACYDIDVEIDDSLRTQMNTFLLSTSSQQDIQTLDNQVYETVDDINNIKTKRQFYTSFAANPQTFISKWLASQSKDLKTMTQHSHSSGNEEQQRLGHFYHQPWAEEAVNRYFHSKIQQKRSELESILQSGNQNNNNTVGGSQIHA